MNGSVRAEPYDILVIGAGILGLSISYHIKKNNPTKKVLLLDRFGAVAQGNTARSNAMFRNTFTSSDNIILSDTSINSYLAIQERSGVDLGLVMCGYLWLMSERQLSSNSASIRRLENTVEVKQYTVEDLKGLLPSLQMHMATEEARLMGLEDVTVGVFGSKCGRLDPSKLSNYFREQLLANGGKIALNTNVISLIVEPITQLGIDGEPFAWQESRVVGARCRGAIEGEIRSEKTIVAAGVWNNEILEPIGIDGHVKAKKRQLFSISARGHPGLQTLLHTRGFNREAVLPFVILPKSACYVKSVEENNEFWVGCEDDFNRPFINTPGASLEGCRAEPSYFEHSVYPIVKEYFPEFDGSKASTMWAGYYSYNTLDSIPFVFAENGVIVTGGGSGSGIMKADAMGRIVDAFYRFGENAEATLHGGVSYKVNKLGFSRRSVEGEEWVI